MLPILGLIGAGAVGAGAGALLSKKEGSLVKVEGAKTFAGVTHAPYETYAPTISEQRSLVYTPQYSYTAQIGSPGARAVTTKKDVVRTDLAAKLSPEIAPVSTAQAAGPSGISGTTIMIVAAAAVGIMLLK